MSRKKKAAPEPAPRAAVEPPTHQRRPSRRTRFTAPLAKAICKMVAAGHTLTSICKRPRMPHERTVRGWVLRDLNFAEHYSRARMIAVARLSDEILDIADNSAGEPRLVERRSSPRIRQ